MAKKKAKKPTKKAAKKPAKKAAKKAVKKVAKKPAKKAAKKPAKTKRKPNAAFMAGVQPDAVLAAIVGSAPLPRTEIVKKLWTYIKKHGLQDQVNRRAINADDLLLPFFGQKQITMFEMAKIISKHVK